MRTKLIIDEDSVYEIDEECDRARKKSREQENKKKNRPPENILGRFVFISEILMLLGNVCRIISA